MTPYGARKVRRGLHGSDCAICHPEQKNLRARGRRESKRAVAYWTGTRGCVGCGGTPADACDCAWTEEQQDAIECWRAA